MWHDIIVAIVRSLRCVWLFMTPWTAACQASLSLTTSQSLPRFISIESVMPSCYMILWCPVLLLPSIFPSIRVFSSESAVSISGQIIGASASESILLMTIQGWFPLGLTDLISLLSKRLSRVFSSSTVQKHQFFGVSLLYGPILTSIHDYWKNHSFDYMNLCWQSDISAF